MEEIIKIGCPICGAVLLVKKQSGIETKNVTCPNCRNRSLFSTFKRIIDKQEEEHTQYADDYEYSDVNDKSNYTLGVIEIPSMGISFRLMPGKNIIGRKVSEKSAMISIPCDSKRMSREHLVIEVKKVQGKGFVHCASLCKEKVNATYIEDVKMEYGDRIILKNNDVIKCPDVDLRFVIPDDDGTEI